MKRSRVGLADVANWDNLARAFYLAARGKRGRADVEAFRVNLERELAGLRASILDGTVAVGQMRDFTICDPKRRTIYAPCFRERVLHHALMAHMGPLLDRSLVDDSYACRKGKGALKAVKRAQQYARRHPWYAQIDIKGYFASIDHVILLDMLRRRFKDPGLLVLVERIVGAHAETPGRGLPIGALTSQHFANTYLAPADRHLSEICRVAGYVRYMDDLVWWGPDRASVRAALVSVRELLEGSLRLTVKAPVRLGHSVNGLSFCGYRIHGTRLLLSRRRRQRYAAHRRRWEKAFEDGRIEALQLQAGYASALAVTVHADALGFRRAQLGRRPLAPALASI